MNKTLFAGIDAGSRAIKIALLDAAEGRIVATGACDQGVEQAARADALLADVLASRGLARDAIASTVATGYGRYAVAGANDCVVVTDNERDFVGLQIFNPMSASA